MKLSIIIPAYNVEKYIEQCICSCQYQDVEESSYEVIIVNDGSTDRTLEIAENVIKKYPNARVITQNNSGLSIARNVGLKKAKGEYVWFVDSDDSIVDNCLSEIYGYLIDDLDFLQIQYQYVFEKDGRVVDGDKSIINGIKSGIDVLKSGGVEIPAQFSIYRRAYLERFCLMFYPHIYHEDTEFKPRALFYAKRVTSYNKIVYNYLQRQGSITSKKGVKHAEDLITVSSQLISFSNQVEEKRIVPYFAKIISCNVNWFLTILDNLQPDDKKNMINRLKSDKDIIPFMKYSNEIRYRLEGKLLSFNFNFGWYFYKILNRFA